MKGLVRSIRNGEKVKYLRVEIRFASGEKGNGMMRTVLCCLVAWSLLLHLGTDVSLQQGPPGCTCVLRKQKSDIKYKHNLP